MTTTPKNQEDSELRSIYERCDVSNNRTDNPMGFDEFKQVIIKFSNLALLAAVREKGPKDSNSNDWDYSMGYNRANVDWHQAINEVEKEYL